MGSSGFIAAPLKGGEETFLVIIDIAFGIGWEVIGVEVLGKGIDS